MTDYPAAVYSPRTKENKAGLVYDAAKTEIGYAEDVTKLDDEVVAIETELGASPKGTSVNVAEKIKGLRSLADAVADTIIIKAGNVGIGILSPVVKLQIVDTSVASITTPLLLTNIGASNDGSGVAIAFNSFDATPLELAKIISHRKGTADYPLTFEVVSSTPPYPLVERMRIDDAGRVGIGVTDPHSKLEVAGAISSATLIFALVGPTDNLNVAGVNTLFINAGANAVTIGGLVGGVDGQILNIVIIDPTNNVTLEHAEGGGNQDILLHKGSDETIDGHYGGWTLICHAGVDWHDVSHAKHV